MFFKCTLSSLNTKHYIILNPLTTYPPAHCSPILSDVLIFNHQKRSTIENVNTFSLVGKCFSEISKYFISLRVPYFMPMVTAVIKLKDAYSLEGML